MLTIGLQAFEAFQREAEDRFVAKLGKVLRAEVPSLADEPEPEYSQHVRNIICRARGFGLASEQAIGVYAITAGLLGQDFPDRYRAARQILEGQEQEERKTQLLEYFVLALFEALDR